MRYPLSLIPDQDSLSMPSSLVKSALIPAQVGRTLPTYDLLGAEQADQIQLRLFNVSLGGVAAQVSTCLSQLFHSSDCELSLPPFAVAQPGLPEGERLWVQARASTLEAVQAWFAITPAHLYRMAILFFGGSLQPGAQVVVSKSPSDSELRLFLRLCRYQLENMSSALGWGDMGWELETCAPPALDDAGPLWHSEADLTLSGHHQGWNMWWRPPCVEEGESDAENKLAGKLHTSLPYTPVRLRVVLSQMQMTLAELEQLQVGEVLALDLNESAPALIGTKVCLRGRVAEQAGNLVFQINTVEEE
ncbi:FliM/FliN family flagellar motor C-terminal domain-containing protein [Aeromonas simiae]|uniref:FliM/FliN family flagellar motor C-terminal domain-containing protein n=2 Tax=Aeromonas simiae TaxID=218936 RepID=UPI0038D09EF9